MVPSRKGGGEGGNDAEAGVRQQPREYPLVMAADSPRPLLFPPDGQASALTFALSVGKPCQMRLGKALEWEEWRTIIG